MPLPGAPNTPGGPSFSLCRLLPGSALHWDEPGVPAVLTFLIVLPFLNYLQLHHAINQSVRNFPSRSAYCPAGIVLLILLELYTMIKKEKKETGRPISVCR